MTHEEKIANERIVKILEMVRYRLSKGNYSGTCRILNILFSNRNINRRERQVILKIILSSTKRRYIHDNVYIFKPYNKKSRINYLDKLIKRYENKN